ncbi:MAG: tRNA lysidine(34) synthetase TilS [Pelovirga sp.]
MTLCQLEKTVLHALPDGVRRVVVAVSGGIDSVVLLHLLQRISASRPLSLTVAHLNHRIRPQGEADARFVAQLCTDLQLACCIESCDVPALARREKISLEMAGRQARRRFLQQVATDHQAGRVALGHHRDDQVETVLLRLSRGSGVTGLAGMMLDDGLWWRPLLECSRQQLAAYAASHRLAWVEDATNRDPDFVRNRLRSRVVPQLQKINPRFAERLGELTRQVRAEEDYWQRQVEDHFAAALLAAGDGLRLSCAVLLDAHPALRMRLLREGLRRVRGHLQGIEAIHLHAIDSLIGGSRSQAQLDLPGCWVARRYGALWLRDHPAMQQPHFEVPLTVPGSTSLPGGQVLQASLAGAAGAESQNCVEFALEQLPGELYVRNWCSGDRLEPLGMVGQKRLKRLFSDLRVEREERFLVPLLYSGTTLLWVAGLRRSRHAVADGCAGPVLRIKLIRRDRKADK